MGGDTFWSGEFIGGWPLERGSVPVKTFTQGRLCHWQGCDTHLSIYNRERYCAQHLPQIKVTVRGKRVANSAIC
jgi:hypothetical protein